MRYRDAAPMRVVKISVTSLCVALLSEPLTCYIFNFWAQLNLSSAYLQHTRQDAKKCSSLVLFLRAAIYFHTLSNTPTSPSLSSLFCKAFKKYNQERRRRLLWSRFYYPPAPFSDHFTFSLMILESFRQEEQVTAFLKELPPCLVCLKTRGALQRPQRLRSARRWRGTLPWHSLCLHKGHWRWDNLMSKRHVDTCVWRYSGRKCLSRRSYSVQLQTLFQWLFDAGCTEAGKDD